MDLLSGNVVPEHHIKIRFAAITGHVNVGSKTPVVQSRHVRICGVAYVRIVEPRPGEKHVAVGEFHVSVFVKPPVAFLRVLSLGVPFQRNVASLRDVFETYTLVFRSVYIRRHVCN